MTKIPESRPTGSRAFLQPLLRRRLLALGIGALTGLAGCAKDKPVVSCAPFLEDKLGATNLGRLFAGIAIELCAAYLPLGSCSSPATSTGRVVQSSMQPLLVADFVALQTLKGDASGLLMGELMRTSLQKYCCRHVIQVEMGKELRIGEGGVLTLSRRQEQLRNTNFDSPEVVVGTYHEFRDKLLINAKIIHLQSQTVLASVSHEVRYTCKTRDVPIEVSDTVVEPSLLQRILGE